MPELLGTFLIFKKDGEIIAVAGKIDIAVQPAMVYVFFIVDSVVTRLYKI